MISASWEGEGVWRRPGLEPGFPSAQALCSGREMLLRRGLCWTGPRGQILPSTPSVSSLGTEGLGSFANGQPGIALVRGTLLLARRRLCAAAAWVYGQGGLWPEQK